MLGENLLASVQKNLPAPKQPARGHRRRGFLRLHRHPAGPLRSALEQVFAVLGARGVRGTPMRGPLSKAPRREELVSSAALAVLVLASSWGLLAPAQAQIAPTVLK